MFRTYQPKKRQRSKSTASAKEWPPATAARFWPVVVPRVVPV